MIDTAALMAGAEDPDAPVPEIVGGKEFLIPPSQVLAHSMDEVDQSLPATRSSVESATFLKTPKSSQRRRRAHGSKAEEGEAALITGTAVGGSLALPYFCAAGVFSRRSRFCSSRTGFSSGRRWF